MFSFGSGTSCAPLKGELIIPTLFSSPLFDLKKAFDAVDHSSCYPNWLRFYFIILLIWGIVDEMIEGDCSHCQRPHVVPVDPDSCQSEKIWEY